MLTVEWFLVQSRFMGGSGFMSDMCTFLVSDSGSFNLNEVMHLHSVEIDGHMPAL